MSDDTALTDAPSRLLKLAIALYCLVGAITILGGVGYLLRPAYLPYHERATGVAFEALSAEHQGTYLGLLKGGGAGGVTVGLALILLSTVGLREQQASAFWMLPVFSIVYLSTLNYSTYYTNSTTQGGPPLVVGMTLMAVVAVAAGFSYLDRSPVRGQ
jgi:hypothetical protein